MNTNRKAPGERISAFDPSVGRPAKYPWDEWFDGSAWRITRGDHFELEPSNMAAVIRTKAGARNGRAQTRVVGDAVEFQFLASYEVAA